MERITNFINSHLELIADVSKSVAFLRDPLKDATRLEKYTRHAWHWNVNMQESCMVWLGNSLKRKPRWKHRSSLETNPTRLGTLQSSNKGEFRSCRSPLRVNEHLTSISFSTLNLAYDQIIASIADSAQDHINLADQLTSQVVEILKRVERKNEEAKKKVRANPTAHPI